MNSRLAASDPGGTLGPGRLNQTITLRDTVRGQNGTLESSGGVSSSSKEVEVIDEQISLVYQKRGSQCKAILFGRYLKSKDLLLILTVYFTRETV